MHGTKTAEHISTPFLTPGWWENTPFNNYQKQFALILKYEGELSLLAREKKTKELSRLPGTTRLHINSPNKSWTVSHYFVNIFTCMMSLFPPNHFLIDQSESALKTLPHNFSCFDWSRNVWLTSDITWLPVDISMLKLLPSNCSMQWKLHELKW